MLEKIKIFCLSHKLVIGILSAVLVLGIPVGAIGLNKYVSNLTSEDKRSENKIEDNLDSDDKQFESNEENDKNVDKEDSVSNNVSDTIPTIEGFSKAFKYDNYVEDDYVIDTAHIAVGDTIKNSNELINKYKLTMNGVTKELVASYILSNGKIGYKLTLGGKVIDEDSILQDYDNIDSIDRMIEILDDAVFSPKYLTFFKGEDGKEYMFMEKVTFINGIGYRIDGFILNSNGDILSFNINGENKQSFIVFDSNYDFVSMDEYSTQFGYKSKKFKGEEEFTKRLLVIDNGKIKYLFTSCKEESDKNFDAIEYELTIKDNVINFKKINTYEVFWNTEASL